jgi:YaiO family outer membrane protein
VIAARHRRALAIALVLAACAAAPSTAAQNHGGATLRLGGSGLDAGYDDWREAALHLEWRRPDVGGAYVVLRSLDRYGLRDREALVGGSRRVGERWDLWAEASVSDDADFAAEHSVTLGASRRFDDGWVGSGSLRHSVYPDVGVAIASGGVERYVGAWRFAWTAYAAQQDGDGPVAWSQLLAIDHYHGDEDRVGGFVGGGRQLDYVPGVGMEVRTVPTIGVSGRQSIGEDWAIDWLVSWERQGDLYRRFGASLGLRRRF